MSYQHLFNDEIGFLNGFLVCKDSKGELFFIKNHSRYNIEEFFIYQFNFLNIGRIKSSINHTKPKRIESKLPSILPSSKIQTTEQNSIHDYLNCLQKETQTEEILKIDETTQVEKSPKNNQGKKNSTKSKTKITDENNRDNKKTQESKSKIPSRDSKEHKENRDKYNETKGSEKQENEKTTEKDSNIDFTIDIQKENKTKKNVELYIEEKNKQDRCIYKGEVSQLQCTLQNGKLLIKDTNGKLLYDESADNNKNSS